ncbi:gamma-aminobutyric acid type B receptor subunit 1-like isoform X3 [Lytechinus variegatus]|uniref:gamma-aminobutyric acid type B receptor subunit 1-like isoform X3 n=1 Tax=Lytechinus variegatus TaxID=7654 RepID=UPI001BB12460|nr:gamma-aminobutyric acid type B receptor subunit 1-like isoform X3 [Lytechinus variegatus]
MGTNIFYNLLYTPPTKIMMLTGCSSVSTPVAEAARMWNLVVLAFGASSPALSNRKRFRTFFRTHPSATLHNPTRIKLARTWGWKRISVIQETQEVFTSTIEDLEQRVKAEGMEIISRQSFLTVPDNAVQNLKRQDARIIVGVFYVGMARRVFCEVYKQKLYGPKIVWFLIGWYPDNWYDSIDDKKVNCTAEQLKEALQYHFTTEGMMLKPDDTPSISGMTSKEFLARLNSKLTTSPQKTAGYPEAPLAYDAIWALALALNKTQERLASRNLRLENYTYGNADIADEIYMALNSSNFEGLSGTVAFTSTGDRLAWTQIEQMIDGQYRKIGYYDYANDNLTWLNTSEWPATGIPKDGVDTSEELERISRQLFILVSVLAGVIICFALCCIGFNLCFQHTGYIQCSQPHVNNVTALGCIAALICVFLLGFDGSESDSSEIDTRQKQDEFSRICHSIAWLISIGFSLGYGSMFSKIWMMHSLVTQEKTDNDDGRRRRRKVSLQQKVNTWKMYLTIGIIFILDSTIILVWQLVDPMYRTVENLPKEIFPEEDLEVVPQLEHCTAKNMSIWLGILYGINGLLLIFGLFLAYETRNMTVRDLNDSRLVGMAIYNVAVLCIITAPVTLIIKSQNNAVYGFTSFTIVFCSAITLALIFIPKVVSIAHNPKGTYNKNTQGLAAPSREDEEKHTRLSAENDEIKRHIKEREDKIKMLTDKIQQKTRSMPKGVLPPSSSSPGTALHQSTPTTAQRTRTSLRVTDKITPPHLSVEDSAYASMAAPTTVTPKLIHGEKVSGINEDDLSETYI